MSHPAAKLNWYDRCIETYNFHSEQLAAERHWTLQQTADALNRSIGSISQDLTIAGWTVKFSKELKRCRSMREALEFVRHKELEMKTGHL